MKAAKQRKKENSLFVNSAPIQSKLESRPFPTNHNQSVTQKKSTADIQAQLKHSEENGFNFGEIAVSASDRVNNTAMQMKIDKTIQKMGTIPEDDELQKKAEPNALQKSEMKDEEEM